jgi:iron(III) transport system substrate-binding protein
MKKLSWLMVVLVFVLGLSTVAMAKEVITIYTSVPTQIMTDIEQAFEEKYPDIDLEVFRSGTGTLQSKIATEVETNNIQADIVWLADFAYYESLKKQGLLKKITPTEAEALPAQFKEENGYYYAGRLINMVIAYNSNLVNNNEAPANWTDLNDKKWYNMALMANPEYSGAAICAVGGLVNQYGWNLFKELRANEMSVVKGNSTVTNKLASGEFKIGIALDYMVRQMKAKGSPLELVYPEDGIVAIPSPIAVMAETVKEETCLDFVNYILSREGQETLVEMGSFIPVRADVNPPAGAPTASTLSEKAMEMDWEYIEKNLQDLKDNFVNIMLY